MRRGSCWPRPLSLGFLLIIAGMHGVTAQPAGRCAQTRAWVQRVTSDTSWVEITGKSGLRMDLRYSDTLNVTGKNLNCGLQRAFLQREAAQALGRAVRLLQKERPEWKLRIYDAGRPPWVQRDLWESVRGTPLTKYVSPPSKFSVHTYGMAIDLTLEDEQGRELDMGTGFDAFVPESGINYEDTALVVGTLLPEQVANRRYLRHLMRRAGWIALPSEWWHFNARPSAWVRENLQPKL